MADKETGTGAAGTEKEENIASEEEVVATVEEGEEATATTTIQEEVVATSMYAKAAEAITMDTRKTCIRQTNNTLGHISNNLLYLQQYRCCTQYQALHQRTRATIWTVMPIKGITMPTVANGATKGSSNCCD